MCIPLTCFHGDLPFEMIDRFMDGAKVARVFIFLVDVLLADK